MDFELGSKSANLAEQSVHGMAEANTACFRCSINRWQITVVYHWLSNDSDTCYMILAIKCLRLNTQCIGLQFKDKKNQVTLKNIYYGKERLFASIELMNAMVFLC